MEKQYQRYHTPIGYSIQRNDIVDIPHLLRREIFYVMGADGDYVPNQLMQIKRYWNKSEPFTLFLGNVELIYGRDWAFVDSSEKPLAWEDVTGYSRHLKIIRGTVDGKTSNLIWSAGSYKITASYTSVIDERLGDTPGLMYQLAWDLCVNPYYEFDPLVGKISDHNWKKLNPNRKAYFRNLSSVDLTQYDPADAAAIQAMQPGDLMPPTTFEKRVGKRFPRPFKLVHPSSVPLLTRAEVKAKNAELVAAGKQPLSALTGDYVEIDTLYERIYLPSTLTEEGYADFIKHIGHDVEFSIKSLNPTMLDADITAAATVIATALYEFVDSTDMVGDLVIDTKIYRLKTEWQTNSNTNATYAILDSAISSYKWDNLDPTLNDFKCLYSTSADDTPSDDNIHQHMLLNLEKIRDMFIVEADTGADVYTADDKTDQSWRMMFSYNKDTTELSVHVATKYQIPDNGIITLTERTSTTYNTAITRDPGELADVYMSVNSGGFTDQQPIDPKTGLPVKTNIGTTQSVGGLKEEVQGDANLTDQESVYHPESFNVRAKYSVRIDGRVNLIDQDGNRVNWFPYIDGSVSNNYTYMDNASNSGVGGIRDAASYRLSLSKVLRNSASVAAYDSDILYGAMLKPKANMEVDKNIDLGGWVTNKYNMGAVVPEGTIGSLRECRLVLNPAYIGAKPQNDMSNKAWVESYALNLLNYIPRIDVIRLQNQVVVNTTGLLRSGGGYDAATTYINDPGPDQINENLIINSSRFAIFLKPASWWDDQNPYFTNLPTDDPDLAANTFGGNITKDNITDLLTNSSRKNVIREALNTFDNTKAIFNGRNAVYPTIKPAPIPASGDPGLETIENPSTPSANTFDIIDYKFNDLASDKGFPLGDWLKCSKDVGVRFFTWYSSDASAPNSFGTFKNHLEIYLEYMRYSANAIVRDIVALRNELQQFKQVWVDVAYTDYEQQIINTLDEIQSAKAAQKIEQIKKKSMFFNRAGMDDADVRQTYPLSYKLTVSGYGVGINMWTQGTLDADTEYAWLVVQRHVDNTSGKPYLLQKAPLHCVYSPAKRRDSLDELPLYFSGDDLLGTNPQMNSIYDSTGKQLTNDSQVIIPIQFTESNLTNIIRLPQDGINTYNSQFIKDTLTVSMDSSQLKYDTNATIIQPIDRTHASYDQGAVKWTSAIVPNSDGSITYGINTASGQNMFTYDETNNIIYLKYMPPAGTKMYVSYRLTPSTNNPGSQFKIQKIEDPEFPDYNMNKTKSIYRFVVRERDVLKPWDFHKSATMHQTDSFAIMNPLEQMSVTPDRNFVFAVPNGLTTQRFYYPTSEVDIIAYTSAEISAEGSFIEISKYSDAFYYDNSITATLVKDSATGQWNPVKADGSAVPYESTPTRVYEGMMSTLPNGNGMRLFFLSNGGPIRPDWTDVDPAGSY